MPFSPHGPCSHFPCKHLSPCPIHKADRQGTHPHNTRAWTAKSRVYLRRHPNCEVCGGVATEVDHIDPNGGDVWENLQSLCKSDHSRKTALFDGGFGRAKVAR